MWWDLEAGFVVGVGTLRCSALGAWRMRSVIHSVTPFADIVPLFQVQASDGGGDQLLLCATMQPDGFHVVQMSISIAALSVVTDFLAPQIIGLCVGLEL